MKVFQKAVIRKREISQRLDEADQKSDAVHADMIDLKDKLKGLSSKLLGSVPFKEFRDDDSAVVKLNGLGRHVKQTVNTILFVDDEANNRQAFKYCFEEEFNVLLAGSAKEALSILEKEHIGVLVTDQRMPDVTGVELCEIVYKKHPGVVLMLVSGYSDKDVMVRAINTAHVRCFVSKPWENDKLANLIRDMMSPDASEATILG